MRRMGWMAVVACLLLIGSVRAADDRAYLVDGVETIGSPGIPGALCVYGERAFTVVIGSVDRRPTPVVAAARLGKGRLVAFGHEGYFGDLKSGDTARLLVNCVRWAASRDVKEGIPKVGLRGFGAFEAHLKKQGIEAKQLGRDWTKQLGELDAVVTSPAGLSQAEVKALRAFVEAGGGVLAGVPGWGWKQLNPGKSIGDELAGNSLFGAAGIAWADGYQGDTVPGGFSAKAEPPSLAHAGDALDALESIALRKRARFSKADVAVAVAAVTRCAMSVPSDDTLFRPKLQRLLTAHSGTVKLPTPKAPLTDADGLAKVILTMQLRRDLRLPPDEVKAHPAAQHFPGAVPADAKRVTRKVAVDTAVPAWHSTGLYAAPGEVVTVTVPEGAARKGLSVRIGAHSDRLWHKSTWSRAPEVCRRFPIDAPTTKAANAFGGLVYIEVPGRCTLGKLEAEIAGAVEAPLYVLGKTTEDDWRKTIRTRPAPWGEVANDKVVITVKAEHLRTLDDPERLMKFWADVMDACADLATIPRTRARPERYVSDAQISAGYMHAGYPIMTWLDAGPRFVNYANMSTKGDWGMFHEMGHNHQSGLWTFGGTGETTVNLFTVYVLETVCKATGGHGGIDPARRRTKIEAHLAAGADFGKWTGDPFLSLAMYLQLKEGFGWDTYKKVFAEYRTLPGRERPRTDDEKRDQWMVRFSRAVGRNLGPFFEKWGVPTSAKARQSISELPVWMPPEFSLEIRRDPDGLVTVKHLLGPATIRYTTDGSEPTEKAAEYLKPFAFAGTGTVKARAYVKGQPPSAVATRQYRFRAGRGKWKVLRASSFEPGNEPRLAIDGDPGTLWHTRWQGTVPKHPHELQIDLGKATAISAVTCLPRQDGVNGRIAKYELYISAKRKAWGKPVAAGTFADAATLQTVRLAKPVVGRYLRLVALSEAKGGPWASLAEIDVVTAEPDKQP